MKISHQETNEKTILDDIEFNTPLNRVDPEYILGVDQAYGSRIQQIHISMYRRVYPDYIDKMCPYSINFIFLDFMFFNGKRSIYTLKHN